MKFVVSKLLIFQAVVLEEELGRLAESAGRGDAKREQELMMEITRLQVMLQSGPPQGTTSDEGFAYVSVLVSVIIDITLLYMETIVLFCES